MTVLSDYRPCELVLASRSAARQHCEDEPLAASLAETWRVAIQDVWRVATQNVTDVMNRCVKVMPI